jgi:hypothetical protein
MSPLREILQWLNSERSFESGFKLYQKYGTNRHLIRRFSRIGDNKFHRELIFEQLKEIARTLESAFKPKGSNKPDSSFALDQSDTTDSPEEVHAPDEKVIIAGSPLPDSFATTVDDLSEVDFSLLPDVLKKLSTRKGDLYRMASVLHLEMLDCTTDDQRAQKAAVIIGNMTENNQIYSELRYFLKNQKFLGEHPSLKKIEVKEVIDFNGLPADKLLRKINSLAASLSRIRKWLKENTRDAGYAERLSKTVEIENEIGLMRERLHVIQTQ